MRLDRKTGEWVKTGKDLERDQATAEREAENAMLMLELMQTKVRLEASEKAQADLVLQLVEKGAL